MPIGGGIYDEQCTAVREQLKTDGVVLIVINGNKGSGFSCQAPFDKVMSLPTILENMAKEIRKDNQENAIKMAELSISESKDKQS